MIQCVAGMSGQVAAMAGIKLPIKTYPLQAGVTQPLKSFLDPMISSAQHHVYLSQTSRGEVVIGGGSDPYTRYNTNSTLDMKEHWMVGTLELFPFLANVKILRQWAGITDMTPDYSPVMGKSEVKNYYLDAGWGTWGLQGHARVRQDECGVDCERRGAGADFSVRAGAVRYVLAAGRQGGDGGESLNLDYINSSQTFRKAPVVGTRIENQSNFVTAFCSSL